ncbi:MAG: LysM peptidoglycan-binding domain-containing protein [Richelia sp. RM2_1_2]|nr:LysM peptidoglycan-binding domain-containing protein [Richelia sp. SM1_7_0]NJN08214.1 LysM peptidoglycan-binding domain-containing protein [Richelia sp. RM1_1_1]NJO28041.1 LysM peptidoglycan-binding domain-containing protein [Richelia sp. SL_2_1]NJO60603.1 LysM peptidoglycan-binding domain-containing protein [Richelia sp. RM2_1_2]
MTLEKLTIKAEKNNPGDFAEKFKVLFNPNQIEIVKTGWKMEQYGPVASQELTKLSLELFFDTTFTGIPPENVQNYTRKIFSLTQPRIGKNPKRPPRCQLIWGTISGKDSVLLPDGFLESVTKKLTHFLEDGTPVRATLNCTFKEWKEPKKKAKIANPIDDPVRIVKRGETLSSIATEEYNDPSLWRIIAEENRLINPRKLNPGMVLTIPPLRINNLTQRR